MPIKKSETVKASEPTLPVEPPKETAITAPKIETSTPKEVTVPATPTPIATPTQPERTPLITSTEKSSFPNAPAENFFDDLYKLSRAKSSPIPKLLFLVFMVVCIGAFAFYYYQFVINKKEATGPGLVKSQTTYTPVTKQDLSLNLEINNPDDETLVFDQTVIVSGKTNPQARIIINDNETFTALQANADGQFSKVVDLASGINQITVYAFDESGNSKTDTRNIYYSETKI